MNSINLKMLSFFKLNNILVDLLFIISKFNKNIILPMVIRLHTNEKIYSGIHNCDFDSIGINRCWNITDKKVNGKKAINPSV